MPYFHLKEVDQALMAGESVPTVSHGRCFCSAVKFELADVKPAFQAYCHCESCRRAHSAPAVASMIYRIKIEDGKFLDPSGKFKIVQGEDKIKLAPHAPTSNNRRYHCADCGTHVFGNVPPAGVINTYPSCFGGDIAFKPEFHSNYEDMIIPVRDGLKKYKGFPGSQLVDDDGQPIEAK